MLMRAVLVTATAAAAFVPWPAFMVEQVYGQRAYPMWSRMVGPAVDRVPIAVFDLLCAGLILWMLRAWWRVVVPRHGGRLAALWRTASQSVTLGCALYLAFWSGWGLNYARQGLEARLDFDRARVSSERVDHLAQFAVERLNALHGAWQARPLPPLADSARAYRAAFEDTILSLGVPPPVQTPTPKPTLLAFYFRWAAIDGLTSPFTHEILVNPYVFAPERPMIVVHEWAHVAGFARESDANFVAALVCLRGDLQMQYSAWLALLPQALPSLPAERRRELMAKLAEGPRADFAAVAARARLAIPAVREFAWRSYDSYLKANHVPSGVANYGETLTLLLGTRASDDWDLPAVPPQR